MTPLRDGHGRTVDHLRLSVTSACNLRCQYCRPRGQDSERGRADEWTDDQRVDLVRWLHESHGLAQVRITGGEPLLHTGLPSLVRRIRAVAPNVEIAITTNGLLLADRVAALRGAGLDRLNISLDSLDSDAYRRITGGDLNQVLAGIDAARSIGFSRIKINTVVLSGVNDHEVASLARWSLARGYEIRFLEAMEIGPAAAFNQAHFVSMRDVRRVLADEFRLSPLPRSPGETATRYSARAKGVGGVVGFIAPITERFCGQCRRIRVTADGRLFPCLLDSRSTDLRPAWVGDWFDAAAAEAILLDSLQAKPESGRLRQQTAMVQLGG